MQALGPALSALTPEGRDDRDAEKHAESNEILLAGLWGGRPADVVRLDYDRRTRRRIALTGVGGLAFLLDLAKAPVLRAGDGIRLEDGRIVAVEAASERLLEITCARRARSSRASPGTSATGISPPRSAIASSTSATTT